MLSSHRMETIADAYEVERIANKHGAHALLPSAMYDDDVGYYWLAVVDCTPSTALAIALDVADYQARKMRIRSPASACAWCGNLEIDCRCDRDMP